MAAANTNERTDLKIAMVGFGEAAAAFVAGWTRNAPEYTTAYDIKTDTAGPVRSRKIEEYEEAKVRGCETPDEAVAGADVIFSLVTADQALAAAASVAGGLDRDSLYLDCNSCAPDTKLQAAAAIAEAGGRYVDVAVMAPVHPALHRTPLLVSGSDAKEAISVMSQLEMSVRQVEGDIGAASSIKMLRSIMMKGMEALAAECVLASRRAGVDDIVLDSLEQTYPGFGWKARAAQMLNRMMVHGHRRAAEMREAALTAQQLGIPNRMTQATVDWQQQIGDLALDGVGSGYGDLADKILEALSLKTAAMEKSQTDGITEDQRPDGGSQTTLEEVEE